MSQHQPAASEIFQDQEFIQELAAAAEETGRSPQQAEKYARKCLREIEATPRDSWLRPTAKLARFIYTRSYEPELDINLEALDELRELSRDHLVLFLWSHKSHMDSFVFLLSLYYNHFRPLPLIFAGINMNFLGFGAVARRVGAIFLRRSFHTDPVYKLVFRHYIDHLIRHRVPLSWSIEGTRSRTGKLSPPKLGILNWVLQACQREQLQKVALVPVSIAFDRIAEIDDYVAIQRGLPKRKESLKWFIDYVSGMNQPNGKVYVRYGTPVMLGDECNDVALPGDMDQGPERNAVTRLAFEVCTRIEQITPIKSADVLTMVLLGANRRALTSTELHQQASEIAALVTARELPAASGFSLQNEEEVRAAVLAMRSSGLVKSFDEASETVYYIPREKRLAAAYYRNTITHYFLPAALGELGLASCALGIDLPNEALLRNKVLALRSLYKFEFFFTPAESCWRGVKQQVESHYPHWDSGDHSLQRQLQERPPRFGHAILRSITEGYLVLAVTLLQLGDRPAPERKPFTRQLLAQGEQMLLRRTISCESSVSQDLIANALRLAEHRQLLSGEDLEQHRQQFAEEVVAALSALNLLQRCYDHAWFSQFSDGRIGELLAS